MTTDPERPTVEKLALDHAWNWFEYHSTQRMMMIRFYLIAAGGIAAGIGALLSAHENVLASILSIVGVLTSLSFRKLDKRCSDLVKIGEGALKLEELKISTALGSPAFEMCRLGDKKPNGSLLYSYRQILGFLFAVVMSVFALTATISIGRAVAPYASGLCNLLCKGPNSG
jgi:hypothetical protein